MANISCTLVLVALATRALAFMPAAQVPAGKHSVWSGVYTPEQAERGESRYRQSCSTCHVRGGDAPPLIGTAFKENWNNQTVDALFQKIQTTMPQENPGTLSRQESVDVIAYILKANEVPAGKEPLDNPAAPLADIVLTDKPLK